MRKFVLASCLCLSTASFAGEPAPAAPQAKTPATQPLSKTPPGKLVVHEWGTFTNFAGSNGVYLDYRPLVDSLAGREFLPVVLHLSGPLLEWLEEHDAGYLDRVGRLARAVAGRRR